MTLFILGGAQTDFARNYAREGLEVSDLVGDVVRTTLQEARVEASEIQTIHVGNAFGMLFNNQGQLGAMPATVEPALWGVPASRHEGACASGGLAILAAGAEIEAGRYDVALVLGVEQEKNVPGDQAARILGAAAWHGHEDKDVPFMWPHQFDLLAQEYDRRYGLDHQHLAGIAELNYRNARSNPNAQTRSWEVSAFGADDRANPVVAGRLRRTDCSQVTDGGAGIVLAGRRFAEAWAARHGHSLDDVPQVLGWGHRTVGLPYRDKVARSEGHPYVMPHVRQAITDAFDRAGLPDVSALRRTTASRRANTSRSTTSASPSPERAGRPWRQAISSATGRCRSIPAGDSSAAATRSARPGCGWSSTPRSRSPAPPAAVRSRARAPSAP